MSNIVNQIINYFKSNDLNSENLELGKDIKKKLYFEIIHINPNVYLAHRGARICVGLGPLEDSYREKEKHVKKILIKQHESIMEHTNIIAVFHIPLDYYNSFSASYNEFLSNLKYCNFIIKEYNNEILMLIGGSIRAYIHCMRECIKGNFFINNLLKPFLCATTDKVFLTQLINFGLINEEECTYYPDAVMNEENNIEEDNEALYIIEPEEIKGKTVDLVYATPILEIVNKNPSLLTIYDFSIKDLYKVSTISFIFHDISRACANQLVRHRNGISQESQRYVTKHYTQEEDFINNIELNYYDIYHAPKYEDIYNKQKEINVFNTYNTLIKSGINKEDARGWLPINVKTKLMMTFTAENYAKFLQLRLDSHAQKEIRCLAEESIDMVIKDKSLLGNLTKNEFITTCTTYKCNILDKHDPFFPIEDDEKIDEVVTSDEIKSFDINSAEQAKQLLDKAEKYKNFTD